MAAEETPPGPRSRRKAKRLAFCPALDEERQRCLWLAMRSANFAAYPFAPLHHRPNGRHGCRRLDACEGVDQVAGLQTLQC